jgi:hypothetical protein
MTVLSVSECLARNSPSSPPPPPMDSWLAHSKVPQGQTDELLTWLSKVQQKKATIRSTRARDFRKEALLEAARVSAQTELEKKQRERLQRWREVRPTVCQTPPSPPAVDRDENLCDCESCFLCQRHRSSMYGKCYCNVIFSPRPMFMDFSPPVLASEAFAGDEQVSKEADNFLASLGSNKRRLDSELGGAVASKRAKA